MKRCLTRETTLGAIAVALIGSLLLALTLAAAPRLHARLHAKGSAANHECAVTLIASGNYEHSAAPIVFAPPQPSKQFGTVPSLKAIWVAAPFLGASIFEHAPPVVS